MNTILLIGNPTTEGKSLADLLKQWENSLHIVIAPDEDFAVDSLSEQNINLIISTLDLEDHKNLKTLLRLTTAFPFIPCLAITNTVREALNYGASYCLQSPLDTVKFLSQVAEFMELETRGTIRGIPIHSFLQMIEGEEKTCTLVVSTTTKTGYLYIKSGTLIGAETIELKGEEAAFEILVWEDVVIEIKYLDPRKKQDIDKPLIYLIMEAYRLKDENKTISANTLTPPRPNLKHISTIGKPLAIEIGTQFKMSFENSQTALVCTLVGMLQGNHVIATAPSHSGVIQEAINKKERITVQYLHMGLMCKFKTTILNVIENPHKLLFLDYPTVIHCREMRRSKRFSIDIPCDLILQDDSNFKGTLKEISTTGGLYHTKINANEILRTINIHTKVQLQCLLPGQNVPQKFDVMIKNIHQNSFEIQLGMLFSDPPVSLFMEFLKLSAHDKTLQQ